MPFCFAHLADAHLGAFRQPELRERNLQAFEQTIDECIARDVDFIIIAGDLFHTPLPEMRVVKRAVQKMREFCDSDKKIYVVYGSHDYSPTETSIIDVLASAGMLTKVSFGEYIGEKLVLGFIEDERTGVKLAGLNARRGGIERETFKDLNLKLLEEETGKKIFVFHSAIEEHKPDYLKGVAGVPLSLLPNGFDYYATGHVHEKYAGRDKGSWLVFPGPTWGADFRDLETLSKQKTGFYIYKEGKEPEFIEIDAGSVYSYKVNAGGLTATQLEEALKALPKTECNVSLVKVFGEMKGNPGEVEWETIKALFPSETVYLNKNSLERESIERVRVKSRERIEVEKELFTQTTKDPEKSLKLLKALKSEQIPGERKNDFETRICAEAEAVLK